MPLSFSAQIHVRGDVSITLSKDTFIYADSITYSKHAPTSQQLSRTGKIYASAKTNVETLRQRFDEVDAIKKDLETTQKIATAEKKAIEKVSAEKARKIHEELPKIAVNFDCGPESQSFYQRNRAANHAVVAGGITLLKNSGGVAIFNINSRKVILSTTRQQISSNLSKTDFSSLNPWSFHARPPPQV